MSAAGQEAQVHLVWEGPFAFPFRSDLPSVLSDPRAQRAGLYLWTFEINGKGFKVNYVGESGQVAVRMAEHLAEYLRGRYWFYDADALAHGKREPVYNVSQDCESFRTRFAALAPYLEAQLRSCRLFLAPMNSGERLRRRVESALIQQLWDHEGREFLDNTHVTPRTDDEEPVRVIIDHKAKIIGMPSELWA